jgi:hypothetical protein
LLIDNVIDLTGLDFYLIGANIMLEAVKIMPYGISAFCNRRRGRVKQKITRRKLLGRCSVRTHKLLLKPC